MSAHDALFLLPGLGSPDADMVPAFAPFELQPLPQRPAKDIPPREPLLAGRLYTRGTVTVSAGIGGGGKGCFALADAISAATGRDLLGVERRDEKHCYALGDIPSTLLKRPLKVWLHTEDPIDEIERRREALLLHYGLDRVESVRASLRENLLVTSSTIRPLRIITQGSNVTCCDNAVFRFMQEQIVGHRIDLLLLDSLATMHSVNENDNSAMELVMRKLFQLADEATFEERWIEKVERRTRKGEDTGKRHYEEVERARLRRPAVDVLHHLSKAGANSDGDDEGAIRGATAIVNTARGARRLVRMSKEEAQKLGIDTRLRRSFVYWTNAKANYLPPSEARDWFKLVGVPIGNGNDEYPCGDQVGVVRPYLPPMAAQQDEERVVLDALRIAPEELRRRSTKAPDWAGNVVMAALGLPPELEASTRRAGAILKQLVRTGALEEADAMLKDSGNGGAKSRPIYTVATGASLARDGGV